MILKSIEDNLFTSHLNEDMKISIHNFGRNVAYGTRMMMLKERINLK